MCIRDRRYFGWVLYLSFLVRLSVFYPSLLVCWRSPFWMRSAIRGSRRSPVHIGIADSPPHSPSSNGRKVNYLIPESVEHSKGSNELALWQVIYRVWEHVNSSCIFHALWGIPPVYSGHLIHSYTFEFIAQLSSAFSIFALSNWRCSLCVMLIF